MGKLKNLEYLLFLGLFFSSLWLIVSIYLNFEIWEIATGVLLIEGVAWTGGR